MSGVKNRVDAYQPAGDLLLDIPAGASADYRRELDLDSAAVTVSFSSGGNRVTRQCLAHAELPVILVRLSAARPLRTRLTLSRIIDPECRIVPFAEGARCGFEGRFMEGVRFAVEARVRTRGKLTADAAAGALDFEGTEALILLSMAVEHDDGDPFPACRRQLDQARGTWPALLQRHLRAHRALYRRVTLRVGSDRPEVPTDARVQQIREGRTDQALLALYANYGRYLLLSASRPGGLVMNLQGKWNEELNPPWECDLHHDVNMQMHYWPAEACGLGDCAEPLFTHLERFLPSGREAARKLYNCRGVLLPIQTDPWGRATPESYGWDVWTGAAAWLAQHLWWHYEFTGDREFLRRRALPFLRQVAAFYEDYLVRHPRTGRLVTVPSQSPENTFQGGTTPVSLGVSATLDIALIRDLLGHAVAASEALGVDSMRRRNCRRTRSGASANCRNGSRISKRPSRSIGTSPTFSRSTPATSSPRNGIRSCSPRLASRSSGGSHITAGTRVGAGRGPSAAWPGSAMATRRTIILSIWSPILPPPACWTCIRRAFSRLTATSAARPPCVKC